MNTFNQIINDHLKYRKQIFKLAKSDINKTYRGAALGWAWAIIKPIMTIAVYWFAFSVGIRKGNPIDGVPFFLWMLPGIVPWFYMSEMLTQGTECIRSNRHLVTKMRFPVSTIPTFVSLSKLAVNLGLMLIMTVIVICGGQPITVYYLQLPIYILLMFMFFTALTMFTSLLGAVSKDFVNLVKAFVTPIFWLSGILYPVSEINNIWLRRILMANPITYLCTGFRNVYLYQKWIWEDWKPMLVFLVILLGMILISGCMYKKIRKDLPDVL